MVQTTEGFDMKRQYVIPDLLASITADALFGGRVARRLDEPAPARPGPGTFKRLVTWMRTRRNAVAGPGRAKRETSQPLSRMNNQHD